MTRWWNHRSLLAKDARYIRWYSSRFLSLTCSITLISAPETNANSCSSTASLRERYWRSARLGDHEPMQIKCFGMEFYPIELLSARRLLRVGNSSTQLETCKCTSSSMISVRIALDCSDSILWQILTAQPTSIGFFALRKAVKPTEKL